jgi:DNA invertase Pin-like site-specific DNA recombinase
MPRTAVLYARSGRPDGLAAQIRELQAWCDRAGVIPLRTVSEVRPGFRASRRCRAVLAEVAAGAADLVLVRDVARLTEDEGQLAELLEEHGQRVAISRDDQAPLAARSALTAAIIAA